MAYLGHIEASDPRHPLAKGPLIIFRQEQKNGAKVTVRSLNRGQTKKQD